MPLLTTDPDIARYMLDPVITTVIIGPGEVKFSIHKALLFDVADYFHAAYRSGLQESKEDVFRFPDIDVAVFQSFSLWLYTGKIHLKVDDDGIPIELYTSRNADPLYCSDSESSYEPDSDDEDEDARSDIPEVEEEDDNEEADEDNGISESGDEDAKRASTHTNSKLFELGLMQTRSRGYYGRRARKECKERERILDKERSVLDEDTNEQTESDHSDVFARLIDLYLLADRFAIRKLRNLVITELHDYRNLENDFRTFDNLPSFENVARAFDNLPAGSPLRTWLVHVFAYDWDPIADNKEQIAARAQLPPDFLMEVTVVNTSRLNDVRTSEVAGYDLDICLYNEHTDREDVMACRQARGKAFEDGMIDVEDNQENEQLS